MNRDVNISNNGNFTYKKDKMKGGEFMKLGKKKSTFLVIALLLVLGISIKYVAGTYAKYTASLSGVQGTATVATWAFSTENANASIDIDLTTQTDSTSLVDDKIAPGTAGTFDLVLSNEDSDVGVQFDINFTGASNVPDNLVFTYNNSSFSMSNGSLTGYIAQGESITISVDWSWPYETGSSPYTSEDAEDTADGEAADTMTISANITAVQTNPTATVTTGVSVAP